MDEQEAYRFLDELFSRLSAEAEEQIRHEGYTMEWPQSGERLRFDEAESWGADRDEVTDASHVHRLSESYHDWIPEHCESDQHGSAAYKKQLIRVYLRRTIDEARRATH